MTVSNPIVTPGWTSSLSQTISPTIYWTNPSMWDTPLALTIHFVASSPSLKMSSSGWAQLKQCCFSLVQWCHSFFHCYLEYLVYSPCNYVLLAKILYKAHVDNRVKCSLSKVRAAIRSALECVDVAVVCLPLWLIQLATWLKWLSVPQSPNRSPSHYCLQN